VSEAGQCPASRLQWAYVRKPALLLAAVLALCIPGAAQADDPAPAAPGPCNLHGSAPLWIDFADGSVPFWNMFAKPGVIAAASNLLFPPRLRAGGAQTIYFDMYLKRRVGVPSAPMDAEGIVARANKLYDYTVQSMGCTDPVIAENELFGANLATPWSPTNAQYRANVLLFLQALRARGANPWLLVNSKPYTAGEAGDWWRQVAQVAGIVREVYFPAPAMYNKGPLVGSRAMRQAFRRGITDFTQIGIPATKIGLYLGFHTTRGTGGREGLAAPAWYETVKWQVLAARTVAKELRIHSIWSWGWGQWTTLPGEIDPEKQNAACVYLWTRDPRLCNGPAAAGTGFDRSRTEGQIVLPPGARCRVGDRALSWTTLRALERVTQDDDTALTALFARTVTLAAAGNPLGGAAAERAIVAARFNGSFAAYDRALAAERASRSIARDVIADQLRRLEIERTFVVGTPSARQVADFYETYSAAPARPVQTAKPAPWLDGRKTGVALGSFAPARIQALPTGRWATVWTPAGSVRVRALAPSVPLASLSFEAARPAIRAALKAQARSDRFASWIAKKEEGALRTTTCWRDALPASGDGELIAHLPFLELPV
jgi:hypothetical protein